MVKRAADCDRAGRALPDENTFANICVAKNLNLLENSVDDGSAPIGQHGLMAPETAMATGEVPGQLLEKDLYYRDLASTRSPARWAAV